MKIDSSAVKTGELDLEYFPKFQRYYKLDIKTKDGVIKTVLLSAEVIEIDGEKYILAVTNDITKTRLAQQELRKGRRLLRF
ncbi:MAG: hypothetical protein F6K18_10435 [Okeania sp. SIO2C2]|uniref:hypothetical protein n=1 Tax=Okeania sp. SIO2C2 TaxID=2607787 RepID=UPI0013BE74D8|nr:hypothetical protein [Okeania sp. SIO2C2]NEP87210.1 hypothetical protein [Okeania sp. SIO2C2]